MVISISQDSLGKPATTLQPPDADEPEDDELYPYWAGELSDGFVVAFVAVDGAESFNVNFSDIDIIGDGSFDWTEAYTGVNGTGTRVSADLEEHDTAIFKITPA
jgi:alpha-galactosidase